MKTITLASLKLGQQGVIRALTADPAALRRLQELGFAEGSEVCALFRAPAGDPTAYAICGTVVALRKEEAEKILLLSSGKV